jgi:hypothetical protein
VGRITGTLHERLCTLMSNLAEFFLEWVLFQTKLQKKSKHEFYNQYLFLRKSCRLWNNVEKYCTAGQVTDDNIIRRMRVACWITKATNTHSDCLIVIAFPRQQRLRERASILCYMYIACLVLLLNSWNIELRLCVKRVTVQGGAKDSKRPYVKHRVSSDFCGTLNIVILIGKRVGRLPVSVGLKLALKKFLQTRQ